ncbi:MAG: adenine phosphoribosyltransferase [Oscillospiraceae bacterium]|nr:adenine phosphoribosyltransferase [Oscillospiraceae bacterium]MDD7428160.1 adenine phosphoribosyltransferase [Oscillospiraceae bacterium]MDY2848431.1 adenine phosphoribosyltransferase [Oscillospiraceae bacterium]
MTDLKKYITDIPDFPKEGIIFHDITTLLQSGEGFRETVDELIKRLENVEFDAIIGLESRGFIFGAPVAYALGKSLVPVRKKGKLPRKTVSVEYLLEYGTAEAEMHADALKKGDRAVIIDDLIATGGTLEAAVKLTEQLGASVVKILCVAELEELGGRERLGGYDMESLIFYGK